MSRTPIEAWPPRQVTGRPGYSRRHYERVMGPQEDPLRVAETIAANAIGDAAVDVATIDDAREQANALSRLRQEEWERLCTSFDRVIATLLSVPQTPAIKRLVREARREARK